MPNDESKEYYTICLEDLILEAVIGILPSERQKTQKILINAEFTYVWNPKTQSNRNLDTRKKFLDYRILRDFIKESFERQFGLLEEAQHYFYREIPLRFPQIKEFWIKITKLEIFEDCNVSIKINYQR
ncbi:dihydroneopterin aldolase [Helicobacter sp.]|uniref:dihydroneopterin aldolase n=1 Tax=Helicobacter sp. TaxID=218 RepID=UPI0019A8831B|nr:dihydroneopterin aldolase [Helicobacter sp.]MBD5164839.1 dihydroneopterin aldolase [Helicobacter sp.]